MNQQGWFERNTGSRLQTQTFCECRQYPGRTHCYDCTIHPEYQEKPPVFNPRTLTPRWMFKKFRTHLTEQDRMFLEGRKPFQPKKRGGWKKTWG